MFKKNTNFVYVLFNIFILNTKKKESNELNLHNKNKHVNLTNESNM